VRTELVCALPRREELGAGRDGWRLVLPQPGQPALGSAASVSQWQSTGSSIPRGFEAMYVVDLGTKLPGKGCHRS